MAVRSGYLKTNKVKQRKGQIILNIKKSNDNSIFQIILKALQRSCYGKILITDMTMKQQHKTDEMATNHIKIG